MKASRINSKWCQCLSFCLFNRSTWKKKSQSKLWDDVVFDVSFPRPRERDTTHCFHGGYVLHRHQSPSSWEKFVYSSVFTIFFIFQIRQMGCVCARAISWVFGVPTSCLLCTHIDSKAGGICAGAKKTDNSQMRANSKEPSIVCYANRNCLIYKFTSKGRVCGDEWLGMRSYHNTAVTIKENENEEQRI